MTVTLRADAACSLARPVAALLTLLGSLRRQSLAPLVWLYRMVPDPALIDADAAMLIQRNKLPSGATADVLPSLMLGYPEFRNLFYYRVERSDRKLALLTKVARRIWKPMDTLDLACDDIGPGFVISHGHGTVVTAARIGRNCLIHHQVTIGWSDDGLRPVLGDDVYIGVGAKILGNLTVGDGARIGANAVVIRDVPAGATAVGVPARIIPRRAPSDPEPGSGREP